jgi:probable F420-dependent oxidoreductase
VTEVVGEVADGYFVHPFHTPEYLQKVTLPALRRGLAKAGRTREDLEISCQLIIASGETEEELERARAGAKAQIAFYGSTPAYRPVLECAGRGELQTELNRLSKQGKWLEMAGLVDDDLLDEIAVVGPRNEIAGKLCVRCERFADRVSLLAPFSPDVDEWADVVGELRRVPPSHRNRRLEDSSDPER